MDEERPQHHGVQSNVCPFLQLDERAGSHLCLWKTSDPIVISPGYVDVYCRVSKHRECSLFLRAERQAHTAGHGERQVARASESHRPDEPSVNTLEQPGDEGHPGGQLHPLDGFDEEPADVLEAETERRDRVAASSAPTITYPKTDSSFTEGSLTISGTAVSNGTVNLFDRYMFVGRTDADSNGRWSITISRVEAGDHVYRAVAMNVDGHESAQSDVVAVSVTATLNDGPDQALPSTSQSGSEFIGTLRALFGRRSSSSRPMKTTIQPETVSRPAPVPTEADTAVAPDTHYAVYSKGQHDQDFSHPISVEGATRSTGDAGVHKLPVLNATIQQVESSVEHPDLELTRLNDKGQNNRIDEGSVDRVPLPTLTPGVPVLPVDRKLEGTPRTESLHGEIQRETVRPEITQPTEATVTPVSSHVTADPLEVVVTPTPPLTASPTEVSAHAFPIDEAVAVPSLDVQTFLLSAREALADTEMEETGPSIGQSDVGAIVDPQPQQSTVRMPEDVPVDTPSERPSGPMAPTSQTPGEATSYHATSGLRNAPQASLRVPRQGQQRRWYLIASAAAVAIALLVVTGFLLRQSQSRTIHPVASVRSVVPLPTTIWSFPPLQPGVDQLIFTFSNPGKARVEVQIKAPTAGNRIVRTVDISARSGAEITLDPQAYHGPLVVQASGPVVAARTTVHRGNVQYTYGVPRGRSGLP